MLSDYLKAQESRLQVKFKTKRRETPLLFYSSLLLTLWSGLMIVLSQGLNVEEKMLIAGAYVLLGVRIQALKGGLLR